jgi:regulatory protein
MGKITALNEQKGDASRVSVFIDGEFVCGLYRSDAEKAGLTVGRALETFEIDELLSAADVDKAYRYGLRFLAVRPRSVAEVNKRLSIKGFSAATAATVIERLTDEGYLDDEEFAKIWIRDRLVLKPKGKRALIAELIQKGVARSTAEKAVGEMLTESEEVLARRALGSIESRLNGEPRGKVRKKAYAFLSRRGFPADVAGKLSREAEERSLKKIADDDS